jgi:isopentenyl phosphate kinase
MVSGKQPAPATGEEAGQLVFVKLGGSVITDKTRPQTARSEVIARLAREVARARYGRPDLRLIMGHGSGSFGHVTARKYGTHEGVHTASDWLGFAEVAAVAARLNRLVTDLFLQAGVPVWSVQPSASAWCRKGELVSMAASPVERALGQGLVPMLHGDVALDQEQGGTIISTEQIFAYLAHQLRPVRMILVGAVDGVYEADPLAEPGAKPVPVISNANWAEVREMLGGSHATDVTGGMLAKVEEMVDLVRDLPHLTVQIISGERRGMLGTALQSPGKIAGGTLIRWS